MIYYPNAKLNLGLRITGRRADGYHKLETIFVPIDLCDALEVEPSEGAVDSIYISGLANGIETDDNLVMRALRAMRTVCPVPPTAVALHKAIPSAAGLGGGSADAAFMLRLLCERYELRISEEELAHLAYSLGADCPFFLKNEPSFAKGIGEELAPIEIPDLDKMHILLVRPPIEVSTPDAYRSLGVEVGEMRPGLGCLDFEAFSNLTNDFEPVVFSQYPRLGEIKAQLYEAGAFFALMSGSGSTLYGLFREEPSLSLVANPAWQDCFVYKGRFLV